MKPIKVVTFGRSSKNDVVLNDSKASRTHCQIIQYDNGSFAIADFGSTNGTFVNGRRVSGTMPLNQYDRVVVGNTDLQWMRYFHGSKKKQKSSTLPWVLGILAGVLVISLVLILALQPGKKSISESRQDGTSQPALRELLGKRWQDVVHLFNNRNVERRRTPGLENNIVYIGSYNYYLVDNIMAVCLEDNDVVLEVCIWDPNFTTDRGISKGTTFGEVVRAYPSVTFNYLFYYYDYQSCSYIEAVYLFDEATCTGFVFKASAFSESQIRAIHAASGGTDFDYTFFAESIDVSIYQSICASVSVDQIILSNCHSDNSVVKKEKEKEKEPEDDKFSYDYYGVIPYNSDLFENGSEGDITLSNGDRLHYQYVRDMDFFPMWYIVFSMNGEDIRSKYKVAALEALDSETGYVGSDEDFSNEIKVKISVGNFIDIGADKLYVIVKNK